MQKMRVLLAILLPGAFKMLGNTKITNASGFDVTRSIKCELLFQQDPFLTHFKIAVRSDLSPIFGNNWLQKKDGWVITSLKASTTIT